MKSTKLKRVCYYDIEGLYCGEWSAECSEINLEDARKTIKEYRENCQQTIFRIKRRFENL